MFEHSEKDYKKKHKTR